jgi:tryptophanyl-tRNA synthetase
MKGRIFSGIQPSGKLHLGEPQLVGALALSARCGRVVTRR